MNRESEARLRALSAICLVVAAGAVAFLLGALVFTSERYRSEGGPSYGEAMRPATLGDLEPPRLPRVAAPLGTSSYDVLSYDWEVTDLEGRTFSLAELRGQVLFINFWATWCVPCKAELPGLAKLVRRLAGGPVAILLISDEDLSVVREFAREHEIDLPLLVTAGGVPPEVRAKVTPRSFIVDPQGRIVFGQRGAVDWSGASAAEFMESLAAGAGRTQEGGVGRGG